MKSKIAASSWPPADGAEKPLHGTPAEKRLHGTAVEKRSQGVLRTPSRTSEAASLRQVKLFQPAGFNPAEAILLDSPALEKVVAALADLYSRTTGEPLPRFGFEKEKAAYWASRFLSLDSADMDTFFIAVRGSALAKSCPDGMNLALAAGSLAWLRLEQGEGILPGSLAAGFAAMDKDQATDALRGMAAFTRDSCLIENVEVDARDIQAQYSRALGV